MLIRLALSMVALVNSSGALQDDLGLAKKDILTWFGGLEYAKNTAQPFVKVSLKDPDKWSRLLRNPVYGFLLDSEEGAVAVQSLSLNMYEWSKNDADSRLIVAPYDLGKYASENAEILTPKPRRLPWVGAGWPALMALLLATAADSRGMPQVRDTILDKAFDPEAINKGQAVAVLKSNVADNVLAMIQTDFGDTDIALDKLRGRLKVFLGHFPGYGKRDIAQALFDGLELMEQDEAQRLRVPPVGWDKMTESQRIDELIFRLRDVHVKQVTNKMPKLNALHAFGRADPAQDLVDAGYPAVPKLIEHLDDPRLTRSVTWLGHEPYDSAVMRVGEAAHDVIEAIAKQYIGPWHVGGKDTLAKIGAERRDAALAWWKQFQEKGEKQMLIDSMTSGNGNRDQAEALAKKYPKDATAAIEKAVEFAKGDEWLLADYVRLLGAIKLPEAKALAHRYMLTGSALKMRVAAACVVAQTDSFAALTQMRHEWETLTVREFTFGPDELVDFLVSTGHPSAIKTLGKRLTARPVWVRGTIVSTIGDMGRPPWSEKPTIIKPVGDVAKQFELEVNRLLASELNDLEHRDGMSMSFGDVELNNPRMCELAAFYLARRLPELFSYPANQTDAQLEAQRKRFIAICKREKLIR
ncbi:MAG: hypothetical protein ABL962_04815 [Fimbriimonadaceae bacterium]